MCIWIITRLTTKENNNSNPIQLLTCNFSVTRCDNGILNNKYPEVHFDRWHSPRATELSYINDGMLSYWTVMYADFALRIRAAISVLNLS